MLTDEQARAALAKLRDVEGWTTQRLAALAKLGAPVRELGRILLRRDPERKIPDTEPRWLPRRGLRGENATLLDRLSEEERRSLWRTLFPRMAHTLERAWRRLYHSGSQRGPFRSPLHPEFTSTRRFEWIGSVVDALRGYDPDVEWLAAWAAHLSYHHQDQFGIVLAAAIDAGGEPGERVYQILVESARGTHEIGGMGRHVILALLVASRPEGWTFIETTILLAAQREEGLRLSTLRTVDEAHPEAFRRMLRLIGDHDLARFSSTIQAANGWFGYRWDSTAAKLVNAVIERVLLFLDDERARTAAIQSGPAESAYLALWSTGFEDAVAAAESAAGLLADPDVERRFVAVHLLGRLGIAPAQSHLVRALDDPDPRVAVRARASLRLDSAYIDWRPPEGVFEALERLLLRAPAKAKTLPAIVWPRMILTIDPHEIGLALLHALGARPPAALIPHLERLRPDCRQGVARLLGAQAQWDAATRAALLNLAGDKSPAVRREAVKALGRFDATPGEAKRPERPLAWQPIWVWWSVLVMPENTEVHMALASADRPPALADDENPTVHKATAKEPIRDHLTPAEAEHLERLLTRKSSDLRLGVLGLLASQDDDAALASADRLLKAPEREPRLGGLELLRVLAQTDRRVADCHARARACRDQKLGPEEQRTIDAILAPGRKPPYMTTPWPRTNA